MGVFLPESLSHPWPRREDFRQAKNYYTAVFSEVLRGPLRWFCRRLVHGAAPSPPSEWRNGLILGASHIGDVLYNTPSLSALRAGLPNCRWTYLVSGASAQVLEGNLNLDEVVSIQDPGGHRGRLKQALAALSSRRFDVAITYAGGLSWRDLHIALALGIPNRVGYVHKGFSGLITHPIRIRFPQPYPAYFRDLVSQLTGLETPANSSLQPLVYLRPEHEQIVERLTQKLGIEWKKQPVLACAVTSRQPTGIWPEEQFFKAIQYIRQHAPCTIIYTGAKSDAEQLNRLAARTGADTFVLAGELDLLPLVALLRRCRAALTPDSGARHLANAAGIPVVFLRNLFNRKIETGAYCDTDHDMSPDNLETVDHQEQEAAFAAIDPATIGAEVVRLLRA